MNLLAQIVPGLRDLRTPFAAGSLWFAGCYLLAYKYGAAFSETVSDLGGLWMTLPPTVQTAAIFSAIYGIGIISTRLTLALAVNIDREDEYKLTGRKKRLPSFALRWTEFIFGLWLSLVEFDFRGTTERRLLDAAAPEEADLVALALVPDSILGAEMKAAEARMAQDAPVTYENLQRAVAEKDFRYAVALPVTFFGICFSMYLGPIIGPISAVASIGIGLIFVRDGAHKGLEARDYYVAAFESGLVRLQYVDRLGEVLATGSHRPPEAVVFDWMVAFDRHYVKQEALERWAAFEVLVRPDYLRTVEASLGETFKEELRLWSRRGRMIDPFANRRLADALELTNRLRPLSEIPERTRHDLGLYESPYGEERR